MVKHIMKAQKHAVGCAFIACCCKVSIASIVYTRPIISTHPQSHLVLSVFRHEGIRHELGIHQDLVVERGLFASEFFIV